MPKGVAVSTPRARKLLNAAFEAAAEIESLERRLEDIRTQCEKITTIISDMPKGGTSDYERKLVALADTSSMLSERRKKFEITYHDVENFIDKLDIRPVMRTILRLRYLEFLEWSSIQSALAGMGERFTLTLTQIYRLHKDALIYVEDLLKEREYDDINEDDL